nr:hypothetical protein Iba_chr07aCG8860 [Ipomoea batatas]GMD18565.1 hypothetical protein Iba_chr07eCG0390 [Ipomoea batatas]
MASHPATQKILDTLIASFRPTKSAIGPLVIAPTIAPNVSMEPNSETSAMEKLRSWLIAD